MKGPWLDRARLAAALLVVCIHTSPLSTYTAAGDFLLTRVLARVAVPFFFMVSGRFLERDGWAGLGRLWRRTLLLYGGAVLLYLPLNWYNGGFSPLGWVRALLVDGTLYHLWYFPALLLGLPVARLLRKLGVPAALALAGLLYLVGLGGDSYYGLAARVPLLARAYDALFSVCSYTRNGLFFAPLFLLLGAACPRMRPRRAALGLALALAAMAGEACVLRALGVQRHDSLYLLLPAGMVCLFALLLARNRGRDRLARRLSVEVYLLHPWAIVLVRMAARPLGAWGLLVENSLGHFAAVLAVTALLAWGAELLRPARRPGVARAWRELDRDALFHNAKTVQAALAPGCRLMAVVKADGYGHGAAAAARCFRRAGVRAFAVACADEGVALRRAGIRGTILILGYTPADQAPRLARWRLDQAVADEAHARALSAAGTPLRVHLALDTGLRRLGIPAEDRAAVERVCRLPGLRVAGVFTHLAMGSRTDAEAEAYNRRQLEAFYGTARWMEARGLPTGRLHLQSSCAVGTLPPQPCGWARVGIALYGAACGETSRYPLALRPALAVRARVALVRPLAAGEGAGYGLDFRAERDCRLAVVTLGYGDGLPRDLPHRGGRVLIRGRSCPMVGWMCMDQTLIDVTGVPDAAPGDVATFLGRDGAAEIRAEELAAQCDTIPNELLSRLSPRLRLVYRRARGSE